MNSNRQIVSDILEVLKNSRTPIILTRRKEHVLRLSDLLKNQTEAHIITLIGTDSAKIKAKMAESLANISSDEKLIIIATGKYVGEGFDYPRPVMKNDFAEAKREILIISPYLRKKTD
jgi:superfamily II DNA or RNA helicase